MRFPAKRSALSVRFVSDWVVRLFPGVLGSDSRAYQAEVNWNYTGPESG